MDIEEKFQEYLKKVGFEPVYEKVVWNVANGRYVKESEGILEFEFNDDYYTVTIDGEFTIKKTDMISLLKKMFPVKFICTCRDTWDGDPACTCGVPQVGHCLKHCHKEV